MKRNYLEKINARFHPTKASWLILYLMFFLSIFFVSSFLEIEIFTYFVFITLGFGWSLLFFRREFSLVEHLLLSPIIVFTLFVFYAVSFSVLGIKLTPWVGYFFMALSIFAFIIFNPFEKRNFKKEFGREELLLVIMFASAIIAKIVSIKGLSVPSLSDPISHTYYANLIFKTGTIPFFYSPGLHVFAAFCDMLKGGTVIKQILYLTNFFSAYSGILAYLYVKNVFKDKIAALVSALMFSLGIALSSFFIGGGKNSLVAGICVLLFSLLMMGRPEEKFSKRKTLLVIITIASSFIVHYPTAVFVSIYWFTTTLFNSKKQRKERLFSALGVIVGMGYTIYAYLVYLVPEMVNVATPIMYSYVFPPDLLEKIWEYLTSIVYRISQYPFRGYSRLISYLFYGGFLAVVSRAILLNAKQREKYRIFLTWFILCFLLSAFLYIFSISDLEIVVQTYKLLLFIFSYICLSFFISLLYSNLRRIIPQGFSFLLFAVVYAVCFTSMADATFESFEHMKVVNVVAEEDLRMFAWIDSNISDKILIVTNGFEARTNLVGPSDSGGWLHYFTGNDISTPFWEFSDKKTLLNLEYYLDLKKDLKDCEAINYFLENNYLYYFAGSRPAREGLATNEELEKHGWDIVKSIGAARLYRIPKCDPSNL